jgi:hypothetical protein
MQKEKLEHNGSVHQQIIKYCDLIKKSYVMMMMMMMMIFIGNTPNMINL